MKKVDEITGIILAGGRNQRMGQNKALINWRGKRLIDWVYDALKPLCSSIIISSNEIIPMPKEALIVPDRHKNIGPAAGIESGLFHSQTQLNIIVSCDTPLLSTSFFSYLLSRHNDFEISIPIHNGINEPMIGIYKRSVLPAFQEAISRGLHKPPAIIRSCRFQEIQVDENMNFYNPDLFLNLNSPEDLKNYEHEKN